MSSHEVPPRNRAERRLAARTGKKARAAGAALTAGSAALAMSAAVLGTGVQSAGAATTLHVTSTADSGAGSLRDVIGGASAGDTIVFDVTGTITLTSGHITIDDALTIAGPGAGALTISGNDSSRVFNVPSAAVTISGLTFAHGSSAGSGGAIATDGPLTLSDSVFDDNTSGDDGGAVYAVDSLTVTNSTFTNNTTTDWGGAILSTDAGAPVNIAGSTFAGNRAGDTAAVAIEAQGNASITDSTFTGNTASHAAAVVFLGDEASSISGSTFTGNTADGTGNQREGIGGAIDAYDTGALSITNSTISGNSAVAEGGGLSLYEIDGAAAISGTTISGNHSGSGGGGAYTAFTYGGLDISGSVITGNTADGWGGGLYAGYTYDFVNVTNTTIADNTAAEGGGGAQVWGDQQEQTVTVTNSTISGNHANGEGGGGWIQWGIGGPTTFANSTISGNTAAAEGGGLYFYGFYGLSVEMSTVTGNTAGGTTGGIFLYAEADEVASAGAGGHHAREAGPASTERGSNGSAPHAGAHTADDKVHAAAAVAEAEITGSIVWGNSGNDVGLEGFVTLSHNVLGTVAAGIVQTDAGGNITGVDPLLGPLQSNGGGTETHALLPGSPAKDVGPEPVPEFVGNEFDQRGAGFARVVDGRSDIGAFEVQPPAPGEAIVITPRFTG